MGARESQESSGKARGPQRESGSRERLGSSEGNGSPAFSLKLYLSIFQTPSDAGGQHPAPEASLPPTPPHIHHVDPMHVKTVDLIF